MAPNASLRAQISYPEDPDLVGLTEQRVCQILERVGVGYLIEREELYRDERRVKLGMSGEMEGAGGFGGDGLLIMEKKVGEGDLGIENGGDDVEVGIRHRDSGFKSSRKCLSLSQLQDMLGVKKDKLKSTDAQQNEDNSTSIELVAGANNIDTDYNFCSTLSTGEKQRVVFARILFWRPRIVFIDEGTSAVDAMNEANMWQSIFELQSCTIVAVSHKDVVGFKQKVLLG
ncbi:hypothetical protein HDU76_002536 [Blyttiomyces sp. JEL0837]|nr:hypothetical protein HDU76_002536 [Blyttiomyces sp. JEL0837]